MYTIFTSSYKVKIGHQSKYAWKKWKHIKEAKHFCHQLYINTKN